MYYTYVLLSKRDQKLYIGYTQDLKQRIAMHEAGSVESTKNRRPLHLVFYEAFISEEDAMRRERYFKSTKGKASLKQVIRGSLGKFE